MINCTKAVKKSAVGLIKRVVLYLRLSDEDKDKLTKEELSESIKNQELMLRSYAEEQGWTVVGVYNDEDWSGADKTRPDFNRMIKECENGNVDIVLCKTQARFARDSELIERYIHDKFHQWGVRFQTVVDKIDNTKRETKKTSQILGLTDEWYLEDTSLNIRETFRAKRVKGQYTGSFVAYGYMKDPENKNHLVIDPVASLVVKRIYNDFLKGDGLLTIVKKLNKEGILSPYEYKLMNGSNLKNPMLRDYSDYEYIEKSGTYKIDVNYINDTGKVLNNVFSFNEISKDGENFANDFSVKISKYNPEKQKLYYTTKKKYQTYPINMDEWVEFKIGETLPNNIQCVAVYVKKLDRTHLINYQLEVTLAENHEHNKYYFKVTGSSDEPIILNEYLHNIRKKFQWCQQTIKKILTDEVYIGNIVQFKTTTVSYKNHTRVFNDEEDWIKKENMHEGIIEKSDWLAVQQKCKRRMRVGQNGCTHPFQNKVFCSYCGKTFGKSGGTIVKGSGYIACKDRRHNWGNCINKKNLRLDVLENLVLEKINNMLDKFYDEEKLNECKNEDLEKNIFADKIDYLNKEYNDINKKLESKNSYLKKLYEDKLNGLLDDKEFITLKNSFKDNNEKLETRLISIKQELNQTIEKKNNLKSKKDIFKKYSHIESLNSEIVNEFVDTIYVGLYDEKTNKRDIKIVWNFAN